MQNTYLRVGQLFLIILLALAGVAIAASVSSTLIPFRYRPREVWKTTTCANMCVNKVPRCLVDCTELLDLSHTFDVDTNYEFNGDFWFNQTNETSD